MNSQILATDLKKNDNIRIVSERSTANIYSYTTRSTATAGECTLRKHKITAGLWKSHLRMHNINSGEEGWNEIYVNERQD
jgi:hypothetical protein